MATVAKDFKVKNGLIVEGTTGTINNFDILTKKQADQDYIVNLIGGTATPDNTPNTVVKRDANGDFAARIISADLTGDVTGTVSDISNHDTDDLAEGTSNKYFTTDRAKDAAGAALTGGTQTNISVTYDNVSKTFSFVAENGVDDSTTDDLTEGVNNLYYTDARVDAYINSSIDTDDVSEGTGNLYFTDARARGAVSGNGGIDYNSTTGVFSADLGYGLQLDLNGQIEIDDTVVATDSDVATAVSDHSDLTSGVHGVTGDVVGTSDAQTLTNKTIGSGTVLSANVDADGFTLTNLATPTNASDAATKGYVDGIASGLTWKEAVNLLAASNVSLTGISGSLVIDGHAALTSADAGYRILLKGQSTDSENGIYVYADNGSTYTLSRSADADTYQELIGASVYVLEGSTYGGTSWVQADHYITGFTGQEWDQFAGPGTYTAGNGLTLTGTEFAIDTTVTATKTYVDDEIDAHSLLTSGIHGVTGDIVGTSDSQSLTNKTLGSGTSLGADLDAANTYKVVNLVDPTSAQDAATKFYVDAEVSGVSGDISSHTGASSGVHGVTGDVVGTSDSQTLTNKTIDGSSNTISNIANASLVNDSVTVNGYETALGSSVTLNTDDVSEGLSNQYFTDARAKDSAAALLTTATLTNITITGTGNGGLTITAENGVADSTTDDLDEGTTNLYFTDARAVSAIEAVTPNFTEVELNSVAKQVAATLSAPTAGVQSAFSWASADYRSAEFLVKVAYGSHTEISKVLLTLDTSDNIAITEYAIVGTNGSASSISAGMSGTDVVLQVTTVNNNSTVTVVGTLLA